MFTWLNKQGVRSDRGFEVQRTGRHDAEYRDGGRIITLSVESGLSNGKPCISIEPTAFERWDNDSMNALIPKGEQMQMLQNFKDAMEFQGLTVVVERGEQPSKNRRGRIRNSVGEAD